MIGHPERARDQHETLDDCRGKATAAARNGIVPVLIADEPTRGADPEQAIAPQLDTILGDVPCDFPVIVAYEPSWAIGQPQPAPAGHIAYTTGAIRELLHARRRHNARIATAAAQWWARSRHRRGRGRRRPGARRHLLGPRRFGAGELSGNGRRDARSQLKRRLKWIFRVRSGDPGLPSFRRTPESPSLWITQRNLAAIVRCAA